MIARRNGDPTDCKCAPRLSNRRESIRNEECSKFWKPYLYLLVCIFWAYSRYSFLQFLIHSCCSLAPHGPKQRSSCTSFSAFSKAAVSMAPNGLGTCNEGFVIRHVSRYPSLYNRSSSMFYFDELNYLLLDIRVYHCELLGFTLTT